MTPAFLLRTQFVAPIPRHPAGGASIWGEHVFNTFSHSRHVVRPKDGAFAGSIWGSGPYLVKVQAHL